MIRMWTAVGAAVAISATLAGAQEQEAVTSGARVRDEAKVVQDMRGMKMRVAFETKTVTGAPYSAEVVSESVQVLPDGNRIVRRTTGRVYRDSQGRVRREDDREPGRVAAVSIADPVAKVSYSLDPETNVAWRSSTAAFSVMTLDGVAATYSVAPDPAEVERRRLIELKIAQEAPQKKVVAVPGHAVVVGDQLFKQASPEWETKVESLPARQMEGVTVEGTRTTRTAAPGAVGNERPLVIVTEEWRSKELGVLVMSTSSDPRTGETTYRLLNISRAEPAPSLFEVPATYTVSESGIRHEVAQAKHELR